MSDASQTRSSAIKPATLWRGADKAILVTLAALAVLAFFDLNALGPVIASGFGSLAHTAPFILFAIFSVAYLKATGAEGLVAKAFTGPPVRMIIFAAIVGGGAFLFVRGHSVCFRAFGAWGTPWGGHGTVASVAIDGPCPIRNHRIRPWI